jgi:hypothetical protein
MNTPFYFSSFQQGLIEIPIAALSKAMYKEAASPATYDYRDPNTGLSFQKASTTRLFIADPSFPIVSTILTAKWQIFYNASSTGLEKLVFVAAGVDATQTSNWKDINQVLQSYNWAGQLPLTQLSQVYMMLVVLDDPTYVVGTLFTPSQPYLKLTYTGTGSPFQFSANTLTLIPYDTVSDAVGAEEADSGQLVPISTGTDTGKVKVSIAGRYLIEASFELLLSGTMAANVIPMQTVIKLNGTAVKQSFATLETVGANVDGSTSLVAIVRIKPSDLTNATYPGNAVLEIGGLHSNTASAMTLKSSVFTDFSLTFLG